MALRIARLGSDRGIDEGTRIGTVRRPPRGVATMKLGQALASDQDGLAFARKHKAEMIQPEAGHALNLLSALSRTSNLSAGCYCEAEHRCHRSLLRQPLAERGAEIA